MRHDVGKLNLVFHAPTLNYVWDFWAVLRRGDARKQEEIFFEHLQGIQALDVLYLINCCLDIKLLLTLFLKWGTRGPERKSNLAEVADLANGRTVSHI